MGPRIIEEDEISPLSPPLAAPLTAHSSYLLWLLITNSNACLPMETHTLQSISDERVSYTDWHLHSIRSQTLNMILTAQGELSIYVNS